MRHYAAARLEWFHSENPQRAHRPAVAGHESTVGRWFLIDVASLAEILVPQPARSVVLARHFVLWLTMDKLLVGNAGDLDQRLHSRFAALLRGAM